MNRIKSTLILLALAIGMASTLTGCDKEKIREEWPPIQVNASSVTIPSYGGEYTFTTSNYTYWQITSINIFHEGVGFGGPTETIYNFDFVKDKYCRWSNEWASLSIDYTGGKDTSNKLQVKLQPNTQCVTRSLTIGMGVGEAFTSLRVTQPAAN